MANKPSAADPPPKVRVAAVAALTLLLGIGIGVSLGGLPDWFGAPSAGAVRLPGASSLVVDCDPFERGGDELDLSAELTCRVIAKMMDGSTAEGALDGSLTGRYLCEVGEGGLRCTER